MLMMILALLGLTNAIYRRKRGKVGNVVLFEFTEMSKTRARKVILCCLFS